MRKLCYFTNSWTFGGVEEHIALLSRAVPASGYDPLVVCSELDALQPLYRRLNGFGVRHRLFDTHSTRAAKLKSVPRLVSLLKAERVALLHVHLVFTDGGRIPILAGRLAGIPVVVTHHTAPSAPQSKRSRLGRMPLLAMVDRFVAVSTANRNDQLRYMGLPAERTRTVRNGIVVPPEVPDRASARAKLFAELGLPADARLVGGVGRLSEQKGFHYLLEAAAALRASNPRAHLLLVGDGPLRPKLEARAAELGLSDIVHFVGFRSDTPAVLAGIDVLAMPSLFEGLPLVLLEAFAAGCPVVAHAVDGIPEVIDDGVNGYLVARGDVAALTERLARLLGDPESAARMSAAAHQKAVQELTVERMAREMCELYGQLLDNYS